MTHRITDGALSATVSEQGAELQSLQDASGAEWLWQAGPQWPRHAPVLFPIVGKLAGDTLRHGGRAHRLTQHGFARDRRFRWTARDAASCTLRLEDDDATGEAFPFRFVLDLTFAVADGALRCTASVSNPGEPVLPFSIGGHPAFAWPLPGGGAKESHSISFANPGLTSLPARRLTEGLLDGGEELPLEAGALPLRDALFAADAVVLPGFPAQALRYAAAAGPALEMRWEGYGDLGLWSKPGAPFLCIEPWHGHASPLGWDGEFANKPGLVLLEPGGTRHFSWSVRPTPG
ncbi:aldose 1-epimerase family protein [Roseomonas sp. BN140053]|uniref:aldose 1-epimerase family protein n=1 Tax=Roseomonas sp. BN140053 TaxID=3391898 RepID=UPI0039ECFC60